MGLFVGQFLVQGCFGVMVLAFIHHPYHLESRLPYLGLEGDFRLLPGQDNPGLERTLKSDMKA